MLESLHLRNFQAHGSLKVRFGPGVTVIVGPTDSGKSAVIRALKWVTRNKPGGDEFLKHGEKRVSVTLRFDGGNKLKRSRAGSRINTYSLNESVFRAFGATVPEPIADALALDDMNFQGQHDAPYWFGDSEGSIAKKLNAVVNLGAIDATLAHCAQTLRTARMEEEVTEKRILQAKADIEKCSGVEELSEAVSLLEQKDKARRVWTGRVANLTALLEDAREARQQHRQAKARAEAGAAVIAHGDALREVGERVKTLMEVLRQAERLRRLSRDKTADAFVSVSNAAEALKKASEARETLEGEIAELRECYRERKYALRVLEEAERELAENTPETCPLCGASMKGHTHA